MKKILAVTQQQAAAAGWSSVVKLTIVPASGAVLPDGKLLLWSSFARAGFGGGGHTYTNIFDPATNTAVERDVANTSHDMFCSGTARLPDGRIMANGGDDNTSTSIYDPATDTWAAGAKMNILRGYNASVSLADGSVMTFGGSWQGGSTIGAKTAEIYTPAAGWRVMSGLPEDPFRLDGTFIGWQSDSHFALFPTANGRVLLAGPTVDMGWLDTRGNGSWAPAGRRGDDQPAFAGAYVMYDAGKILKAGGATWNNDVPASASAYAIDATSGAPVVRKLAPMAYPRLQSNGVALPNGQVLIVGGQTYAREFSDDFAVLAPELWDPVTETFTTMPAMSEARNYHSIALLLPDGRVASAGGGLCSCAADHYTLQVFSPPYLFNADGSAATRPVINAAPATVKYGGTAAVTTSVPVASFAAVRMGSTTHTVNNGQRRVSLSFTSSGNNSYQVAVPNNPGILLPGQWMLFAMDANGTPSVAKIFTVDYTNAPQLQNPGDVTVNVGSAVNIAAQASTPSGTLSFSATGLPSGLTVDASTGRISGSTSALGNHLVTLLASNGAQTVSTNLVIAVQTPGNGSGLLGQYFGNTNLAGTPVTQRVEQPGIAMSTTVCAPQGGTCNFTGTQIVTYGTEGLFAARLATGSIACNNDVFGDPAPGQDKKCYAGVQGTPSGLGTSVNFSARWSGSLEAVATGATTFRIRSGAGVRLWVNNQLLIDNWAAHAPAFDSATLNLVAGQRYPVLLEYVQGTGTPRLEWAWQPPGTAMTAVPASRLYAAPAPASTNVAAGKPATQSSLLDMGIASRAVDGSTDGNYINGAVNGSVTHTAGTAPQDWWQVDLGSSGRIDLVQLWNRSNCCSERLRNFTVFVSPTDMTGRSLDQLRADAAVVARQVGASSVTPTIGIPIGAAGRFVRVQLQNTDFLSLAEVQVFGEFSYGTPSITPVAAQQATVGAGATIAIAGTDPGSATLNYSASGLPPGLAIDARKGVISGTPTAAGSFNVVVKAANDGGKSASTSFGWTVLAALPQVTSLPAPMAPSGSSVAYNPVLGAGAASQYSWNFGDGSADTAYATSAATTHTFAAPGVYSVTLTIRSADGRSATKRFQQAVYTSGPTAMARASSPLILEPRSGKSARLWVVNADNDSVSVFDTANNTRLAEITVGTAPRTLAQANDGRVWVVNKQDASISIVDPTTLAVAQTVSLPRASQPHGIVISPADGSAFVALEASGQLLKINGSSTAVSAMLAVGPSPRHLALSASGDRLLVSRFVTRPLPGEGTATVATTDGNGAKLGGEVLVVNPATLALQSTTVLAHSERTDSENQGRGIPNYLGAAAISPDGKTAWVPSKQDNIKRGKLRDGKPLDFQSTVRSITSRIDLSTLAEDLAGRVDHDNSSLASAAVYHPTGAYLFVALETSRQVAVLDAAGKRELFRFEVGLAPQGLVVSADGLTLYVSNFMGRSVSVIDLRKLVGFGQIDAQPAVSLATVAMDKLNPIVLRGKQLFYDARDPRLARDSYMSCASCHSDAGHDGRTWDFTGQGEGLRNTTALKGRAGGGQGFMHWSANFDEAQDFEGQIRALAGGTGLMADADFNAGTRSKPLGDKKAGLSADLDALAAYLGSLTTFSSSPYRNADGTMTAPAQAGRSVFAANCASCHGGVGFTGSADVSQLKNIGTLKPSSGKRLNGSLSGIDIPTLRDVWATAPYLHDGSAATLSAAISAHNNLTLNATDLASVTAYVQQIGGEEAQPVGNLALGKPATQSSDPFGSSASRAVDGRTDGVYSNKSVTHTGFDWNQWWQVDLQTPNTYIDSIRIWNRTDCCVNRLSNYTVFVSGTDMTGRTYAQLNADAAVWKTKVASMKGADNLLLPVRSTGRYVRVQLDGLEYLSLAEVQVFGAPTVNLALGKAATQSSDPFGNPASRAVDGNTSGVSSSNSFTHTGNSEWSPWWQVDLQSGALIDTIRLWNRTDNCCASRLSNFTVFVSNTDMTGRTLAQLNADAAVWKTKVASLNGAENITLIVRNSGRYVRVQLDALEYLSLAEVQVFGR